MTRRPDRIKRYAAAVAVTLLLLPSFSGAGAGVIHSVGPWEAKELIESNGDLLVIDVRTPGEYRQGALPGSKLLPLIELMRGNHDLPREKPILLVCAVGGRSQTAARQLVQKGYRDIYNLQGGLSAWVKQKVPMPRRTAP